ncbi:enoyl-CoA hydratase/isomerase family protein [Arenicella xantha]|uniref:Enoyl-CoA hydratase n=1 Tax=Arenicella xantha TaxID=644221 RepID=A0A395JJ09_9GAMM|nr:enoyl-CoA hydratase-related protein [Arenicella xantha]RBP48621.1 enoyl-CoA hydratase [Arenicella xantha]
MKEFQTIEYKQQDRIATIAFNRPDAANGLNLEMATEFALAAQRAAEDASLKAVILTGNGRFFCAGGDVKAMQESPLGPSAGVKQIADELHKAISILSRMATPLIVAVNGTAAGAGFSTAVIGDLVVAAESAKFTMAYTNVGLSPDGSASYFMPRLIGLRKTQELMFTNKVLNAQEALHWGLINRVVPDAHLMAAALEWAEMFANGASGSFAAVKSLLLQSPTNELEAQMALEAQTIAERADSADGQEGIDAFVEKRRPTFS